MTTVYAEKNLFSTRTAPWMKLGKLIDEPVTAAEAAKLAGLDFEVAKRSAGYMDQDGIWQPVRDQFVNVRLDTGAPLGFVGKEYTLLQSSAAFSFMDGVGPYIAAGELKGGRQAFMVCKPDMTIAPGGDEIELFVTLRTSHDRTRAVEIQLTSLRGMCMNQLYMRSFTKNARHRWAISHNRSMEAKMHQAGLVLAQLGAYAQAFEEAAEKLMLIKLSPDAARRIAEQVITHGGRANEANVNQVMSNWRDNTTTVGFNGTGWAMVNAVSEHMDWQRRAGTPESRFRSALNGQTHRAINLAADLVLAA